MIGLMFVHSVLYQISTLEECCLCLRCNEELLGVAVCLGLITFLSMSCIVFELLGYYFNAEQETSNVWIS